MNAIVSFRHRCVREDTSASWTRGFLVCVKVFTVCAPCAAGLKVILRPVAAEAMRRGVAGAHPALFLDSGKIFASSLTLKEGRNVSGRQ